MFHVKHPLLSNAEFREDVSQNIFSRDFADYFPKSIQGFFQIDRNKLP